MFETLVILIVGVLLGFTGGMLLLARAVRKTLDKEQAEAFQSALKEMAGQLIFLRVEETPNLFLAYDALSGDFICQGTTMEDLSANFGKRYPAKKGILVEPEKGQAHELV